MTRARTCIPRILEHEGGFVDHFADPGGATNLGITIATFRRYIKPTGTVDDLRNLTEAQAVIVYKRQYWDKVLADDLPIGVDYAVADFAVNSGPDRAARYLQRVVGAVQDGVIGPNTLKAVSSMAAGDIVNDLCDARMSFLQRLSHWPTFKRGWTRRVSEVRADSLDDIRSEPGAPIQANPDTTAALKAEIAAILEKY